jgi:hypothetical protein
MIEPLRDYLAPKVLQGRTLKAGRSDLERMNAVWESLEPEDVVRTIYMIEQVSENQDVSEFCVIDVGYDPHSDRSFLTKRTVDLSSNNPGIYVFYLKNSIWKEFFLPALKRFLADEKVSP